MDTTPTPEVEHTREDFARTQSKILDSHERGHGVTLAPAEVERLVAMMQGMELALQQRHLSLDQTQKILTVVLGEMAEDDEVKISGELLEDVRAGYFASWDEETNIITFELVYPEQPEEVEGEVVEGDTA